MGDGESGKWEVRGGGGKRWEVRGGKWKEVRGGRWEVEGSEVGGVGGER